MFHAKFRSAVVGGILLAGFLSLTGCKEDAAPEQASASAPVIEVTVYKIEPKHVELSDVLPGRVAAFRIAEIRPQVSGIIKSRSFEQGTEVAQGQVLYQIDPAPFEADRKTAEAALKRAEATAARTKTQSKRLKPLMEADAISGQVYDDAVAAELEAQADLLQAQATLERRKLDLKFASVDAPIPGRIDQAIATEGALVSAGDANAMAVIQQIDQVFVDVKQPAALLETIREAATDDQAQTIRILSDDGKSYDVLGKLLFSGISVDPATGEVLTRVLVPNEKRLLLPGMFVQAELPLKKLDNALTVPQQAVKRQPDGQAVVNIVDEKGSVTEAKVTTGGLRDGWYIIESGLKSGDNVMVEGHDRLMPETPVKPVPWHEASPDVKNQDPPPLNSVEEPVQDKGVSQ